MKLFSNYLFLAILATFFLSACTNLSNQVDNKLNELKSKTDSLDKVINKEVDKVLTLDSLINNETSKVKKLDSLINKNTTRIDSVINKKVNSFK
jgi:peptidoglycan hydrolase CwlO-like protein